MADDALENIGPRGRRRRVTMGFTGLLAGIALVALLVSQDVPAWWRLAAFGPFWAGALGFLQVREAT